MTAPVLLCKNVRKIQRSFPRKRTLMDGSLIIITLFKVATGSAPKPQEINPLRRLPPCPTMPTSMRMERIFQSRELIQF